MISTTAAFDAKSNASPQFPVIVLSLPGLSLTYTMRNEAAVNATATWMKVPTGVTQKIEDLQGKASIGTLQVEIVDVGRALLQKFATTTWYGQTANLLLGFSGLAYPGDYITLFAGIVETVVPSKDHTAWIFTLRDKNRILKKRVYAIGDDGVNPVSTKNPKTLYNNSLALVTDLLENQLGLAASAIDTASISALQNGRFAATTMLFSLTKATEALSFLEQQLLMPLGLFHFTRYDGRIAIGDMLAVPSPVPIAFNFTPSNIVGVPSYAQQPIYNWLAMKMDYDGSNYLHIEEYVDSASVNRYGLSSVLSITSDGLRTNLQGASRAGITARRIFQRYGQGPTGMISFDHPSLQAGIVEVGDYVTITHPLMENLDNGTLGWTNRICQVMSVQPAWSAGKIQFTVLDVNSLASRPAYQYAPDTVPAWTSATAAQRAEYLFQANSSSQQSDGTAAGRIF